MDLLAIHFGKPIDVNEKNLIDFVTLSATIVVYPIINKVI